MADLEPKDIGLDTLKVWLESVDLVNVIYKEVLPHLPEEEKWGLNSQVRRAVQSVPANIAEGYGRYYYQDNIHFCYIARGSLDETYSHLTIAKNLGYITENSFQNIQQQINQIRKMLNKYIIYLKNSKKGINEPGNFSTLKESFRSYSITTPGDNADIELPPDI